MDTNQFAILSQHFVDAQSINLFGFGLVLGLGLALIVGVVWCGRLLSLLVVFGSLLCLSSSRASLIGWYVQPSGTNYNCRVWAGTSGDDLPANGSSPQWNDVVFSSSASVANLVWNMGVSYYRGATPTIAWEGVNKTLGAGQTYYVLHRYQNQSNCRVVGSFTVGTSWNTVDVTPAPVGSTQNLAQVKAPQWDSSSTNGFMIDDVSTKWTGISFGIDATGGVMRATNSLSGGLVGQNIVQAYDSSGQWATRQTVTGVTNDLFGVQTYTYSNLITNQGAQGFFYSAVSTGGPALDETGSIIGNILDSNGNVIPFTSGVSTGRALTGGVRNYTGSSTLVTVANGQDIANAVEAGVNASTLGQSGFSTNGFGSNAVSFADSWTNAFDTSGVSTGFNVGAITNAYIEDASAYAASGVASGFVSGAISGGTGSFRGAQPLNLSTRFGTLYDLTYGEITLPGAGNTFTLGANLSSMSGAAAIVRGCMLAASTVFFWFAGVSILRKAIA